MRHASISSGLRFGLLLQLAIGPVCLFVLKTAAEQGFVSGLLAVTGVAIVDAAYIALATLGITRWAESERMQRSLRFGGAAVLVLFGLDILASACGIALLPSLTLVRWIDPASNAFLSALALTASNPLTILFWAGVFGAKVAAERYSRQELWLFSAGCVCATILFLSAVALVGAGIERAAPQRVIQGLNAMVGIALLFYAVRLASSPAPRRASS